MKLLILVFGLIAAVTFPSCSGCSSRGVGHYDTTQVDTMLAVDLDKDLAGDGTYVSSWIYLNDSAVANMQSAPNKMSQITASNRMNIRVRYLGRVGVVMENSLLEIVMIQPTSFVSMRMEKRWGVSSISQVSVSKQTLLLSRTQKLLLIVFVNIVLSRLRRPPLPAEHLFIVLMVLLHWREENRSKVLPS